MLLTITHSFYLIDFLSSLYVSLVFAPVVPAHQELQIYLQQYQYAYTGLLTCGDCKGPLSATTKQKVLKNGELKIYTLYYCISARKGRTNCSQGLYTNAEVIEKQIDEEIEKFTIISEFKDWALEVLAEQNDEEIEERTKIYKMQQNTINDGQKQLDNLTRLRIQELIDDEEYMREKKRLKGEIATIKQKISNTEERAESWLKLTEKAFDFACNARKAFANGENETKKVILSTIGVNWQLKDHKLEIKPVEWLIPIREHYPAIETKMQAFELGKKPYTQRQKEAFTSLRPLVQG